MNIKKVLFSGVLAVVSGTAVTMGATDFRTIRAIFATNPAAIDVCLKFTEEYKKHWPKKIFQNSLAR